MAAVKGFKNGVLGGSNGDEWHNLCDMKPSPDFSMLVVQDCCYYDKFITFTIPLVL